MEKNFYRTNEMFAGEFCIIDPEGNFYEKDEGFFGVDYESSKALGEKLFELNSKEFGDEYKKELDKIRKILSTKKFKNIYDFMDDEKWVIPLLIAKHSVKLDYENDIWDESIIELKLDQNITLSYSISKEYNKNGDYLGNGWKTKEVTSKYN